MFQFSLPLTSLLIINVEKQELNFDEYKSKTKSNCISDRWAHFALETCYLPWDLSAAAALVVSEEFSRSVSMIPSPRNSVGTTMDDIEQRMSLIDRAIEASLRSGLPVSEENARVQSLVDYA